jgi:ribulose-5-phosphate 4-epimerase/fuculose-1-phosphate aldolase
MEAFNGQAETAATVAKALAAWQEAYSYMQRTWGTVTVTDSYDPSFVAAKRSATQLGRIYQVKMEALKVGQ